MKEMNKDTKSCCASCGKAEGDGVQLRTCTACKSVRYCGVICQRNHRPKHKKACKKRAAELRDEILFKQPESSHLGDCPICCLPLPLDKDEWDHYLCCSKLICNGCLHDNLKRESDEAIKFKCPFCRCPLGEKAEALKHHQKRVEANDPYALRLSGSTYHSEGDHEGAFKQWTKAAKLGEADAHCNLSVMYRDGNGVEKDEKKEVYHAEEAAILGHPEARQNLNEVMNGRYDRAAKHFTIAANLGHDDAIQIISNEDFAAALRAHKAAVDATKSPQRETRLRLGR